jgi:hypothetical protein
VAKYYVNVVLITPKQNAVQFKTRRGCGILWFKAETISVKYYTNQDQL